MSERVERLHSKPQKRYYISGPMTGIADYNRPAFMAASKELARLGLDHFNPATHGLPDGLEWSDYLRFDIRHLTDCTHIYMLPGWEQSKGARLEHRVARELGLIVTGPGIAGEFNRAIEALRDRLPPTAKIEISIRASAVYVALTTGTGETTRYSYLDQSQHDVERWIEEAVDKAWRAHSEEERK